MQYTHRFGGFPHSSVGEESALVTQLVKNLPAMWETWVRSLGWEDPLEKGKATSILQYSGLENSMHCMCSPWGRKELDTSEWLSLSTFAGFEDYTVDIFGGGHYSIHHSWDEFHVLLFIAGMKKILYIYLSICPHPCGVWDLSFLTGDQTLAPCSGSRES